LEELAPIDVGEEVVRLDLCSTVGTQSALGIAVQQAREKIPSGRGDDFAAGECQGLLENLAVHFVGVLVIERRKSCQHLIQQDTESPPIDGLGVSVAKQKFGSEIFGSSAEG
jgi:hypothetical protein